MLKRIFLALAVMAGAVSPSFGAGTLPGFSLSQQMGSDGKPLAGCKLYIIQAGTTSTPQTAYQDSALTIPAAGGSQLTCDAAGRIGQFFLADGSIKIRLENSSGVTQFTADGLLVVGPSGGGGGGASVDPTTILATGDVKAAYGTSVLSGFVRMNGRTIGSATSGGTERANLDCQALFQYLWAADTALAVSGGRGVSAAADWASNKTIALPDGRGTALAGLDDMGNSAKGTFTAVPSAFTRGDSITVGSLLGNASRTLNATNLPATLNLTGATSGTVSMSSILQLTGGAVVASNTTNNINVYPTSSLATITSPATTGSLSGAQTNAGGGQSFSTISPYLLLTLYIKL